MHNYEDPNVTITSPTSGVYDPSMPITWELNNPDDGRPIFYDLEYSIDNQNTFNVIATSLTSPSHLWTNPTISENDELWFKITAYSIDAVLNSTVISTSASTATLSVNQLFSNAIKSYPNPVETVFNIDFNSNINGNYAIIDISGRVIISSEILSAQTIAIPTKDLNSGVYFVVLKTDEGNANLRFVKQ